MILEAVFKEEEAVKANFGVVHHVNKVDASFVANALKGKVSGSAVAMTDVSPLEHNIGVKLASDTITDFSSVTLTKQGKNLLPHPYVATTMSQGGIDWTYNEDGTLIANGTPIGNYAVFFNLTKTNLFKDGVTYTVGVGDNDVFSIGLEVFDNQVNKQISINTANPFTWDNSRYEMRIMYIMNTKVATVSGMVIKPQVEVGTVATEFEPYKAPETVSVNADGTAFIIGNGESMTLATDTDGVTISAEYNRDLNKAFESLVNAIISLGGNV